MRFKTNQRRTHQLLTFLFMVTFLSTANAHQHGQATSQATSMAESVEVSEQWARETFKLATTAAAYATIKNAHESKSVLLISASADASITDEVQLHDMLMEDGMMKMQEIEGGIRLAPGEHVSLAPGGKHIMFLGLKKPFTEPETVSITLEFEDGSTKDVTLPVKNATNKKNMHHH